MSKKKELIAFSPADCEMMSEAIQFFYAEIFEFGVACPAKLRSAAGSAKAKLINLKPTDGLDEELPLTVRELSAVINALRYIADGVACGDLTEAELPQNLCSYSSLTSLAETLESAFVSE